jgi:hypothetical protein
VPGASPGTSFSLTVLDIDGPPVDVLVNGRATVSGATCDPTSERPRPMVVSDEPFPWRIDVVHAGSGAPLGSFSENGAQGPKVLLVRPDGVRLEPLFSDPGSAPISSCAP